MVGSEHYDCVIAFPYCQSWQSVENKVKTVVTPWGADKVKVGMTTFRGYGIRLKTQP